MSSSAITPDAQENDPVPQSNLAASLSTVQGASGPVQVNTNAPNFNQDKSVPSESQAPKPTSRLQAVLSAVANTVTTGLAGIPDKGRSSFVTGLGEGARANIAAQANEQNIKFRTFDDQLRAAQLHNDDIRLQNQTQAQNDAHQAAENTQRDYDDDHNIEYNPHPSVGDAVVQTLQARSQADPAGASIAPGTYHSADGNTIMEPNGSDETNAGLTQKYRELQSVLNLPALQPGSQYVSGKNLDLMGKILKGSDMSGKPLSKEALQNYLAGRDAQRAALVKNNVSSFALQTYDDLTNMYKADLKNHQDAEDKAADIAAKQAGAKKQAEKQGEINAENSPEGRALAQSNEKLKEQAQDNAAGNKPQKAQNVDANGNPVWVAGASADEKKKAELAENMVFNINNVASILRRRPDIVGKVAGRITSYQQMIGSNDQDIVALGTDMHNIGMANGGLHGMRSPEQAEQYVAQVLNGFKNGPAGVYGGLKSSASSVQTFIDAARPETYKTHSKNGGAIRVMVANQ